MRHNWGVSETFDVTRSLERKCSPSFSTGKLNHAGTHFNGREASWPLTPPDSPAFGPVGVEMEVEVEDDEIGEEKVVLLYVGRM